MLRTQDGWKNEYENRDALWIHGGNPAQPHALLTSGKHSNGFFNSRLVIEDELLLKQAATDLLDRFAEEGGNIENIQCIVGPQKGATKMAELLCLQVGLLNGIECFWASPAKSEENGKKSMIFSDEEKDIPSGKTVLLCEDVLTTGGSVIQAAAAVTEAGGTVLPFILVLVNRSGLKEVDGKRIVALIDREMPMWDEHECPLCKDGSEAVRPKDNWDRLTKPV